MLTVCSMNRVCRSPLMTRRMQLRQAGLRAAGRRAMWALHAAERLRVRALSTRRSSHQMDRQPGVHWAVPLARVDQLTADGRRAAGSRCDDLQRWKAAAGGGACPLLSRRRQVYCASTAAQTSRRCGLLAPGEPRLRCNGPNANYPENFIRVVTTPRGLRRRKSKGIDP